MSSKVNLTGTVEPAVRKLRFTAPAAVLKSVMVAAVVLFAANADLCAQTAPGSTDGPAPLKMNPLAALRAFEPDANQEYQLGRGDEISIDVAGRPEFSRHYIVGPDGRVTLPLAGPVSLVDKTREQAATIVEQAFGVYYQQVSVTVGIDHYTSNHVLLLGAVEHPGLMSFDQPPTLLEVISRGGIAGGTGITATPVSTTPGVFAGPTLQRPPIPERCAIYRGDDQVMWVDLKGLLDSGSSLADLRLKRDDVIYVPSPADRFVSVLGQVGHPGAIQIDSTTTLQKLLAQSGGLTVLAGNNPKIQVISPISGKTRVISLDAVLMPSKLDLTLQPGDVVFVPESGFNKVSYVFERLSPLITAFTAAAVFAH